MANKEKLTEVAFPLVSTQMLNTNVPPGEYVIPFQLCPLIPKKGLLAGQ